MRYTNKKGQAGRMGAVSCTSDYLTRTRSTLDSSGYSHSNSARRQTAKVSAVCNNNKNTFSRGRCNTHTAPRSRRTHTDGLTTKKRQVKNIYRGASIYTATTTTTRASSQAACHMQKKHPRSPTSPQSHQQTCRGGRLQGTD